MKTTQNNIEEEIEDKVIDWITLGASGRLIASKPDKNKFTADLLVEKKGDYKGRDIWLKICSLIGPVESEKITKDFLEEELNVDKDFYLLFAYFDTIKQKISDYIWLVPSIQFRDIADMIKSENGQRILRFEASLDIKQNDKYSKFLVYTKELGKLALEAFEADGKFKFKETIFQEVKAINLEVLKEFITEARLNTYAANNSPADNPRLLQSTQLEFQKGNFFYRDIFFSGNKKIIGQEIIYQDSKPVWGMNYIGDKMGKLETNFLKDALFRRAGTCRLGQNCEFEKREFKYEDKGQGTSDDFFGQEQVFLSGKSIYKLEYRGGLISDKL